MIAPVRGGNESFCVVKISGAMTTRNTPYFAATPPEMRVLLPFPAHKPPSFREYGMLEFVTSCPCGRIPQTPSDLPAPDQKSELVDQITGKVGAVPFNSSRRARTIG